jgi:hypothetical protein
MVLQLGMVPHECVIPYFMAFLNVVLLVTIMFTAKYAAFRFQFLKFTENQNLITVNKSMNNINIYSVTQFTFNGFNTVLCNSLEFAL